MSSYLDYLRNRIQEIQTQIESNIGERDKLISELESLKKSEFEEDMRTEGDNDRQQMTLFG